MITIVEYTTLSGRMLKGVYELIGCSNTIGRLSRLRYSRCGYDLLSWLSSKWRGERLVRGCVGY